MKRKGKWKRARLLSGFLSLVVLPASAVSAQMNIYKFSNQPPSQERLMPVGPAQPVSKQPDLDPYLQKVSQDLKKGEGSSSLPGGLGIGSSSELMLESKPSAYNTLDMGSVKIEGVEKLITSFANSAIGTQWHLNAYVRFGEQKIYLADLAWSYKPDDGTFAIDTSDPVTVKVTLMDKSNIWADPKLKMSTKDYVFNTGFSSEEGGASSSLDSLSFSQCSYPVEFYTANRNIFNYPAGYDYKFYVKRSDGTFTEYKDYDEYGYLEVDLVKGFRERLIFTWNDGTAGKKTKVRMDIYKDGKKIISQNQKMESDCGKAAAGSVPSYTSSTGKSLAKGRNPKFFWSRFEYLFDESTNAFFITLPDFRIRNNVKKSILQLRKYYVEIRLYHKNYPKDGDMTDVKEHEKNILKINTRIYPYHITGHKIFLDKEMDAVKEMGYILEKESGIWFDGYFRVAIMLKDEDQWYDLQVGSPYSARFRYRPQTIFAKSGYEIELKR